MSLSYKAYEKAYEKAVVKHIEEKEDWVPLQKYIKSLLEKSHVVPDKLPLEDQPQFRVIRRVAINLAWDNEVDLLIFLLHNYNILDPYPHMFLSKPLVCLRAAVCRAAMKNNVALIEEVLEKRHLFIHSAQEHDLFYRVGVGIYNGLEAARPDGEEDWNVRESIRIFLSKINNQTFREKLARNIYIGGTKFSDLFSFEDRSMSRELYKASLVPTLMRDYKISQNAAIAWFEPCIQALLILSLTNNENFPDFMLHVTMTYVSEVSLEMADVTKLSTNMRYEIQKNDLKLKLINELSDYRPSGYLKSCKEIFFSRAQELKKRCMDDDKDSGALLLLSQEQEYLDSQKEIDPLYRQLIIKYIKNFNDLHQKKYEPTLAIHAEVMRHIHSFNKSYGLFHRKECHKHLNELEKIAKKYKGTRAEGDFDAGAQHFLEMETTKRYMKRLWY